MNDTRPYSNVITVKNRIQEVLSALEAIEAASDTLGQTPLLSPDISKRLTQIVIDASLDLDASLDSVLTKITD